MRNNDWETVLDQGPKWLAIAWTFALLAILGWSGGPLGIREYAVGLSFVVYPGLWFWYLARRINGK